MRGFGIAGSFVLAAWTGGCVQEAAYYGPLGPDHATGYTDQQIDALHYRVTYAGNSRTTRSEVEGYLLLRSAEITTGAGYTYFQFDTRDTKSKTSYFSSFTGWPGWGGSGGYGWYGPGPLDAESETTPFTQYEAYAEIVLLTPDQAKNNPRALDAPSVIAHLGAMRTPAAH
jgi:hypothetical protein